MNAGFFVLIGLVLALISIQTQTFAESDSIFPQWIRQSTEIWVNGDITDSQYLALMEHVLNNGILQIETVDDKNLKHAAKMVMRDIPELSQNVDPELIPLWTKDRAQWWVEGKITDEQFFGTIHYLRESGYLGYAPEESHFAKEQTFQSDLEKYLLTEKEILNIIKQTKWRVISAEYGFEERQGVTDSVRIMFTDISRVYDPAFYKFKVPSLVLQIAKLSDQKDLDSYWNSFDRNDNATIFQTSYLSADPSEDSRCFFDYRAEGAVTSCSYKNMVFHVVIFDEYAEHYDYDKKEISLDEAEPTTRFAGEILEKINFYHNDNVNTQLHKSMQTDPKAGEPESPLGIAKSEPETSPVQGVEDFSCTRDDFGLVTVSGTYNNGNVKRERVDLAISFYDRGGDVSGRTGTTLYDLEKFEVKRFLGHAKWNGSFHDCQVEIR